MPTPDQDLRPPADEELVHHELPVHEVVLLLGTHADRGLSTAEAADRLRSAGPNVLPRLDRRGPWLRLLLQFHHPLIYILLVAAAVTLALGEVVDSGVILAVVLINAAIGFVQESRAEKALDALTALVRTEATVVRDGARHRISSEELVPGDVVVLEPGDKVPADLRFVSVEDLHVDESALTGESLPVAKEPAALPTGTVLGDRANMGYSTTLVTRGRGRGVVVATGADTEIGHIHRLVGEAVQLETPLTRKIGRFSRILTAAIIGLALLTFALGTLRGEPAAEMLTAAVALAVGAIPEGLPAVVTITLAIGVSRMARRRAIIRRLPAVETLGSTTVICTDKTGTLTANAMTVVAVSAGGRGYAVSGSGYGPAGQVTADGTAVDVGGQPALRACLVAGVLCNDSRLTGQDGRRQVIGDPTEAALLVVAEKAGLDLGTLLGAAPRLATVPFDSERQWMATLHHSDDGRVVAHVKGAVERLLAMSSGELRADGTTGPVDADAVHARTEEMTGRALRVLAMGTVELPPGTRELGEEALSGRLVLTGLQGMLDPPRPEAVAAVRACRTAGIRIAMITGDHAGTARAIGEQFGLGDDGVLEVLGGADLARVPDDELPDVVRRTAVFARVNPEQKLRLVEALQREGHVVAMTGDGVNDAPALRRADIGVAMGVGGTEVAKEAADMVLTDDDFASIEAAVEEGRGVFDNLRKFITFMLPTSFGEGLVILAAVVLATTLPVLPTQVLWINMTTAVALGLALAFEPLEADVMSRPPVPPSRPLLTGELIGRIVLVSTLMLLGAFAMFEWAMASGESVAAARTVAVNVFVVVEVAYLLNCRSLDRSIRRVGLLSNPWVPAGMVVMLALQLVFTYAPWMNALFDSAPIDAVWWVRVTVVGIAVLVIVETEKWLRRRLGGRRRGGDVPATG
ncbi:HAD-IC family P-type ATPase [Blastococcus tunisiensis]|uniref:Probable cation-transporting ATPase F n=1 Tax=Blastococcus tunisiensis TaxID=1798228 RepID=A0A1I2L644_9ACTN|nr:HAD-IC family P-type ATPase [Blastococcus sp. DSM 46838]SFF72721.1 cation-transporting ATPase F [Blastococcus sp. DSM 46838]